MTKAEKLTQKMVVGLYKEETKRLRKLAGLLYIELKRCDFPIPWRSCPNCHGWEGGKDGSGEGSFRHAKDCSLKTVLTMAEASMKKAKEKR